MKNRLIVAIPNGEPIWGWLSHRFRRHIPALRFACGETELNAQEENEEDAGFYMVRGFYEPEGRSAPGLKFPRLIMMTVRPDRDLPVEVKIEVRSVAEVVQDVQHMTGQFSWDKEREILASLLREQDQLEGQIRAISVTL